MWVKGLRGVVSPGPGEIGLALTVAFFSMLISKRWEPQILKMSPRAALLPDTVSDRCWNTQLPEGVLERSVSRLLLSTSLPP